MMKTRQVVAFTTIWMMVFVSGFGLSREATAATVDGEWVLAANSPHAELYVYNAKTGQVVEHVARHLGSDGGGVFDIAITPDGKTAIVSNFGDGKIFFLDIRNPVNPTLLGIGDVGFFAEDIDITADGKFAAVTDGGFSSRIAVFDIQSMNRVDLANLAPAMFQSVAISPNGTVLGADYWNGGLQIATIDGNGWISYVGFIHLAPYNSLDLFPRPVNVGIAPDGQTVIMVDAPHNYVTIFKITGKGQVEFTGFITGLPTDRNGYEPNNGGGQSVTFSPDGKKAFLLRQMTNSANWSPEWWLSTLNILGPGVVELDNPRAYELFPGGTSQLFGVDSLTYASGKIVVGNATLSGGNFFLQAVDLASHTVEKVAGPHGDFLPTGVATIPSPAVPPPVEESLDLTSPGPRAKWKIGSNQTIRWTEQGLSGNLEISLYKKGTLVGMIATVPVTDLQYAWKAGQYANNKYVERGRFKVKIRTVDGAHEDISPNLKLVD